MKTILLFCFFCIFQGTLVAQDTHYWTNQFGARGALMGGAAIAGLDDNSAVYYNPANLAFIKQSTISLNTSVYKYDDMFIGNGAGENVDLKSQRVSLYQQLISGLLTKNPEKKYRLGFNIITRQHVNFDFNERHQGIYDIIPNQPGTEDYIGSIELSNSINETWGCLGGSFKVNENFSVGLTTIVSYRNQKYSFSYAARAYNGDSASVAAGIPIEISTNSFYLDTRTNIISALFKAGFHGRIGAWRFGLNMTSPSVAIWGESRVQREDSQTNLQGSIDRVRSEHQDLLRSEYRYPFSIGAGIEFIYKTGMIAISAEYFAGVQQYKMIESDPNQPTFPAFLNQGKMDFLTLFGGADEVVNGAIGWEQQVHEKFKIYFGFRSDFSYARSKNRIREGDLTIVSAPIDLWHFTAGFSWLRKASHVSIGVNYTYGHRDEGFSQLINFTSPVVQKPLYLVGQRDGSAYINFHSITLLIGYTYYFALK